jgi:hypothetical protein
MPHGENAQRHYGRDYWSRRYPSTCLGWGRYAKRLTHRYERQQGKRQAWREVE